MTITVENQNKREERNRSPNSYWGFFMSVNTFMKKLMIAFLLIVMTICVYSATLEQGMAILVGYRPAYGKEIGYVKEAVRDSNVALLWLRDSTRDPLYIQYIRVDTNVKSTVEKYYLKGSNMRDEHTGRMYDLYFSKDDALRFYRDQPRTIMITPRTWVDSWKGWQETWMGLD